ncbi:MAG TPA: L-2-amino-thiazoline-4-carboxylic acid hydrolase [Anaerolineales bacterium]|nr:L-2-amino-thiazoline-4-carboxylic acid hydrolase [Anaerolineales bacterium]
MKLNSTNFYTSQSNTLLGDFDQMVRTVKNPIISKFGELKAKELVEKARWEYQRLLPDLPYVGGEQPFTQFVIASGWFLAFYRVMQAQDASVDEAGKLAYLLSQTYLERVPGFARKLLGYMTFSHRYLKKLQNRAESSHSHPFPRGYVFSFIPGDGVSFDYGVDYHQCATWTLFQEQGAAGLTPYLCACDYLYSRLLGWGLTRTTTLSEGGSVCDFRFKRGGPTKIHSTVLNLDEGMIPTRFY